MFALWMIFLIVHGFIHLSENHMISPYFPCLLEVD